MELILLVLNIVSIFVAVIVGYLQIRISKKQRVIENKINNLNTTINNVESKINNLNINNSPHSIIGSSFSGDVIGNHL